MARERIVYVNSDNKLDTFMSSRRFKDEIKPMDKTSEAILALKPVTFRYKKEIEPNGGIMFGLIAEEVEKVDPDLVSRNDKGEAGRCVRCGQRDVAQRVPQRTPHSSGIEREIAALTATVQKVSAQVEMNKPVPRTVATSQ